MADAPATNLRVISHALGALLQKIKENKIPVEVSTDDFATRPSFAKAIGLIDSLKKSPQLTRDTVVPDCFKDVYQAALAGVTAPLWVLLHHDWDSHGPLNTPSTEVKTEVEDIKTMYTEIEKNAKTFDDLLQVYLDACNADTINILKEGTRQRTLLVDALEKLNKLNEMSSDTPKIKSKKNTQIGRLILAVKLCTFVPIETTPKGGSQTPTKWINLLTTNRTKAYAALDIFLGYTDPEAQEAYYEAAKDTDDFYWLDVNLQVITTSQTDSINEWEAMLVDFIYDKANEHIKNSSISTLAEDSAFIDASVLKNVEFDLQRTKDRYINLRDQLENDIKAKFKQLDALSKTATAAQATVAGLKPTPPEKRVVETINEELANTRASVDELKRKLDAAKAQLSTPPDAANIDEELKSRYTELKGVLQQIQMQYRELGQTKVDLKELKEELKQTKKEIDSRSKKRARVSAGNESTTVSPEDITRLETQIADLKTQKTEAERARDTLKEQVTNQTEEVTRLKESLDAARRDAQAAGNQGDAAATEELAALKTQLAALNAKKTEAESARDALQQKVTEHAKQVQDFTTRLKAARSDANPAETQAGAITPEQLEALKTQLAALESEKTTAEGTRDTLQKKLTEKTEELDSLRTKLKAANINPEAATEQLKALQERIAEFTDDKNRVEKEFSDLSLQLDKKKADYEIVTGKIKAAEDQITQLSQTIDELRGNAENDKGVLQQNRAKIETLLTELNDAKNAKNKQEERIRELEENERTLKAQVDKKLESLTLIQQELTSANEQLQSQLEKEMKLNDNVNSLNQTINDLTTRLKSKEEELKKNIKELENEKVKNGRLQQDNHDMQLKVMDSADFLEASNLELDNLKKVMEAQEKDLTDAKTALQAAHEQEQEAKAERQSLQERLNELTESNGSLEAVQKQLQAAETAKSTIEAAVEEAKSELSEANTNLEATNKLIEEATRQLARRKARQKAVRAAIRRERTRLETLESQAAPAVPTRSADVEQALAELLGQNALAGLTYNDVVNNACLYATVAKVAGSVAPATKNNNTLKFNNNKLEATIGPETFTVPPRVPAA